MIEIELEGEVGMVRAVDDVDHGIGGAQKKARPVDMIDRLDHHADAYFGEDRGRVAQIVGKGDIGGFTVDRGCPSQDIHVLGAEAFGIFPGQGRRSREGPRLGRAGRHFPRRPGRNRRRAR